jgi:flavin-dependent dehydrogenase
VTRNAYDAIIVGARVAGAVTGMLLARAGLDVLVVDRARYGSDTLSTHALMRGGVLQLSRWGLLDEVVAAGTPPVRRTVIRYGDIEEVVDIDPSPGAEALYAPRRVVLDRLLADGAFRAGADIRFGLTATGLLHSPDGTVTGISVRDRAGRALQARAPITIGADGVGSRVARAVRARTYRAGRHAAAMVVGWFSDLEADGYQWLYGHGADGTGRAAGIIPTNHGQVCAWAGLPSRHFPMRRPAQHLTEVLRAIAPDWADRLVDAARHGPVRGFRGVCGYFRQSWGPGWALVGDAGYFKDPITAHGITDAFRDAELLARAVVAAAGDPRAASDHLACYQATRDRLSGQLLSVSDQVATFSWSLGHLRELLLAMSASMRTEVRFLEGLPGHGASRLATVRAGDAPAWGS